MLKIEIVDSIGCSMMANFQILGTPATNRNTVMLSTIVQPASYPYFDYIPFKYTDVSVLQDLVPNTSVSLCSNVCSHSATCVGFVISEIDSCKLKSITKNPVIKLNSTVYYQVMPKRQYTSYNFLDFDAKDIVPYNGNRRECRQACDALPGCVGYVIFNFYREFKIRRKIIMALLVG